MTTHTIPPNIERNIRSAAYLLGCARVLHTTPHPAHCTHYLRRAVKVAKESYPGDLSTVCSMVHEEFRLGVVAQMIEKGELIIATTNKQQLKFVPVDGPTPMRKGKITVIGAYVPTDTD